MNYCKHYYRTGGSWLITNMRRSESMFDVDPCIHDEIAEGIKTEGSNLCGISAHCLWEEINNKGMFVTNLFGIYNFHYHFLNILEDETSSLVSVEDSMSNLRINSPNEANG